MTQSARYRYKTWLLCTLCSRMVEMVKIAIAIFSSRPAQRNFTKSSFATTCTKSTAPRTCADRATIRKATQRWRRSVRTRWNRTMPKACAKTVIWASTTRNDSSINALSIKYKSKLKIKTRQLKNRRWHIIRKMSLSNHCRTQPTQQIRRPSKLWSSDQQGPWK